MTGMAAEAVTIPTGKNEGATTRAAKNGATGGSLAGGAIGIPVASIVVYLFNLWGVDLGPIETALAGVITLAFSALAARYGAKWAGTAVPTDQVRQEVKVVPVAEGSEDERLAAAQAAGSSAPAAPKHLAGVSAEPDQAAPSTELAGVQGEDVPPVTVPVVVEVSQED